MKKKMTAKQRRALLPAWLTPSQRKAHTDNLLRQLKVAEDDLTNALADYWPAKLLLELEEYRYNVLREFLDARWPLQGPPRPGNTERVQ